MITVRVNIEHDDDTQGEPRNVTTEAMFELASNSDLFEAAKVLAEAAVKTFVIADRVTEAPFGVAMQEAKAGDPVEVRIR